MEKKSWDECWGDIYNYSFKYFYVLQRLIEFDRNGEIGQVVLDVGCGADPLSNSLDYSHQCIQVDIVGGESEIGNILKLEFDVEQISDVRNKLVRSAIARVANFLGINCYDVETEEQVDFIILSEVLNYIDYKTVIKNLFRYLKPGGTIYLLNKPGRGYEQLFSEKGVKNNNDLMEFLKTMGVDIELVKYLRHFSECFFEEDGMIELLLRKSVIN